MAWQPLQSSMLAAFDYDAEMRVLHVRFRNGALAAYQGVPADVARGLSEAPSAGRYFHQNVKDRFVAT